MNKYPKTSSHVGISVPNLEAAVDFYENVMRWYTIMKPTALLALFNTLQLKEVAQEVEDTIVKIMKEAAAS